MKHGINHQLENDFLATVKLTGLPEPVREFNFMSERRFRWDFCYPEVKLAIEIQGGVYSGGRHVRGTGYESDARKANFGTLYGWRILRFTASMVRSWEAARTVKEALGVKNMAMMPEELRELREVRDAASLIEPFLIDLIEPGSHLGEARERLEKALSACRPRAVESQIGG